MIMIPLDSDMTQDKELDAELNFRVAPSYSFLLDHKTKRIKRLGSIVDEDALRQSIYFMLRTRRYSYEIYSRDYGAEFWDFFGQDNDEVLMPVKVREDITDTLLVDDRIINVTNFMFEKRDEILIVSFYVEYDLGQGEEEMSMEIGISKTGEVVMTDND